MAPSFCKTVRPWADIRPGPDSALRVVVPCRSTAPAMGLPTNRCIGYAGDGKMAVPAWRARRAAAGARLGLPVWEDRSAIATDTAPAETGTSGAEIEPAQVRTEVRPPGGYRAVLALPAFRRLWFAQLAAALGEALASIAMPLLAYAVSGSAQLLSLIFVVQLVPRVVLAPAAGVLADRVDRRRLMIGADLGRAALVLLLPLADRVWQIAVLATLVAVGNTLARPAELAAVPMVVPPGLLVQALSVSQVAISIVRILGPALGAALVGLTGTGPAFVLQALCFFASAGALTRLALPAVALDVSANGASHLAAAVRRELGDGLRVVVTNPVVRGIAAVEALWQVVTACFVVALVVFVDRTLRLGENAGSVYALLMATFGAGTTLGALVAGRIERRIGRPRLMAVGYLAPLMLVPAGLTPPLPVLFACWFALGFGDAWAVIAMQAYLAEAVPDALRGRVYAAWGAAVAAGAIVAFAVAGWATTHLGPPATLALGGALVGIGGPLLLLATGALATLRLRSATPPAGDATSHPRG